MNNYTNQVLTLNDSTSVRRLHKDLVSLVTTADPSSKSFWCGTNVWCQEEHTWCHISRLSPIDDKSKQLDEGVNAYDLLCSYDRAGEILATM